LSLQVGEQLAYALQLGFTKPFRLSQIRQE